MCRSVLVLAGAFALAGCGGEDRLSKEEFVQKADATCERYEKRLEPLERQLTQVESIEEAGRIIDRAIPVVREGVAELRELEPPEDLEGKVDRWLDLNEENTKTLEQLRDAAKQGDEKRIAELARQADETEKRGDRIAAEIGLEDCAEES